MRRDVRWFLFGLFFRAAMRAWPEGGTKELFRHYLRLYVDDLKRHIDRATAP